MPPSIVEALWTIAALVVAVGVGTTAHELSHVLALSASGVPCRVTIRPDREQSGDLGANLPGAWATVTPTAIPRDFAPWRLRTAAMMPLCLAAPFALAVAGVVPDPFVTDNVPLQAAAIGWLGCALPSPRDFSLLWYPRQALADRHSDGEAPARR